MSTTSDDNRAEGLIGRKMVFSDRLQTSSTASLIKTCPDRHCFVLYCGHCSINRGEIEPPCHRFRLVFSDGACRSNGQVGATAGIGILYGEEPVSQRAIPITSELDPGQKRTGQRAELLAALAAVRFMAEADELNREAESDQLNRENVMGEDEDGREGVRNSAWVIATDSKYVVKGMTEWLPTWKSNGLRTNRGTRPANLTLFLKLDAEITTQENRQDLKIGFWHIAREYNTNADALAKEASAEGDPE